MRQPVRWITQLEAAPTGLVGPVVWLAAHAEAAAWPLPPPTSDDLADAARAKREGGAPRLLRRRMLRALAARLSALHPEAVRFARTVQGAPTLTAPCAFISAAGCAGWSAVAIGAAPLGVDVEATSTGPPADLRRWTLVEAYLKRLGLGLSVDPERVQLDDRGAGAIRLALPGYAAAQGWVHEAPELTAALASG